MSRKRMYSCYGNLKIYEREKLISIMRYIVFTLNIIIALVIGFLFAGLIGSILFGLILSLSTLYLRNNFSKQKLFIGALLFLVFSFSGYILMHVFGLLNANYLIHSKVEKVKNELIKNGYQPKWFIISQKRYSFYNNILKYSVKKDQSKHIKGKAIDLYVIDIDNNGEYDKEDFNLIKRAAKSVEKKEKQYKGGVFNYLSKKEYLVKHMVHFELD